MRFFKKLLALTVALAMLISCVPLAGCVADAESVLDHYSVTAPTNLPAIHITLDDDVPLSSVTKEKYVAGKVSVVGSDEYDDLIDVEASIKGRGNYSWSAPKKPYNLKFDKKTDLLGMGSAKKWVMTANYWDKTMLRNYITLMLAKEMGINYAVDVAFVDLYINEEYMGNYLVSEKVEIGKQRINIDDENGGVLLEIEQPYRHGDGAECDYCHELADGVHLVYSEPEPDDMTEEAYAQLMQTTNAFLDEMDASLSQGYEAYSKYIDLDSFIDWYILSEFCKNYDSRFVTSCYVYYDPEDQKLHMGPPWDYDTCYGNQDPQGYGYPQDFYVKNDAQWYRTLFEDSTFAGMVMERWTQLKREGVIGNVLNNTIAGAALIDESQKLNFAVWPDMLTTGGSRGEIPGHYFTTFKEEVDYLKRFVALRIYWLDEQWNTDYDSTANKVDTVNIMTKGLLLDNSMSIENIYKAKTLMLYRELDETARAQLAPDVARYYSESSIARTDAAIAAIPSVVGLAQREQVAAARSSFDELTLREQLRVADFDALLAAEARIAELSGAGSVGIGKEVGDLVDRSSITAPDGYGNEGVANLFDGNLQTKYCVPDPAPTIAWRMTEPTEISSYTLTTANDLPARDPKSWVLEGSNDESEWTIVDNVENGGLPEERFGTREFFCDSPAKYRYYRLAIRENKGEGITQFSEITLRSGISEAARAVADRIRALGTVSDLSKKEQVDAIRTAYNALSAEDAAQVGNYVLLVKAEIALMQLSHDTAVDAVNQLIAQLPDLPTAADATAILTARCAYEKLSETGKLMVDNPTRLGACQAAILAENSAAQLIVALDELPEAVTYRDAPQIYAARAAFDALSAQEQTLIYNLEKLTRAEAALKTIHDAFDVEVKLPDAQAGALNMATTPWMNVDQMTDAQLDATLDALSAEIRHQYVQNGYCFGLVDGYYELDDHGGFAIVQTDMGVYGTSVDSDNVSNPWGMENRYWAGIVAPFSGMAFSVNGYFSQSFPYAMPLCNAFEYNGRTYQVFSNTTQSHTATLLLRGTRASILSEAVFPGSGDEQNNNTFAYAYAAYAQANKATGSVLGVPEGDVRTADGGRVKYQRFNSNDGLALLAGSAATMAAADANGGAPLGAYSVTGKLVDALLSLGADLDAAFAVTGAPIADAVATEDGILQQFEKGVLWVTTDGRYRFAADEHDEQDAAAAKAVSDQIDALPEWSQVTKETFADFAAQVNAAQAAYEALTPIQKSLLADAQYLRLCAYLEHANAGWQEEPTIVVGDVDGNGSVDVSDIIYLKNLIMAGKWTDAELARGDQNNNGKLDVADILAVKGIIMG